MVPASEEESDTIHQVTELLQKLGLDSPLTKGFCCKHQSQLIRALFYTKREVSDLVFLNQSYKNQVDHEINNIMKLEKKILKREVFELEQDVLRDTVARTKSVNFFMSLIFQGLMCGL